MAVTTLRGCRAVGDAGPPLPVGHPSMALGAAHLRVSPAQRKLRVAVVIESHCRLERVDAVTALASGRLGDLHPCRGHPIRAPSRKLLPVRPPVAVRAALAMLTEEQGTWRGLPRTQGGGPRPCLEFSVALGTGHRRVGAGQGKTEPLVGSDRDRRGPETASIVAGATSLSGGCAVIFREPASMGVGVTIRAGPLPEGQQDPRSTPVDPLEGGRRRFGRGDVTATALYLRMLALEGKPQPGMLFGGESTRLETLDVVTRPAGA